MKNPPIKGKHNLHIKWIGTYSPNEKKLRLFKFLWATGMDTSVRDWHSSSLRISLWPRIFNVETELWGWAVTFLCIRIHRKRAYGGWL